MSVRQVMLGNSNISNYNNGQDVNYGYPMRGIFVRPYHQSWLSLEDAYAPNINAKDVNNVHRIIHTETTPQSILNTYRTNFLHDFHVMLDSGANCGIFKNPQQIYMKPNAQLQLVELEASLP